MRCLKQITPKSWQWILLLFQLVTAFLVRGLYTPAHRHTHSSSSSIDVGIGYKLALANGVWAEMTDMTPLGRSIKSHCVVLFLSALRRCWELLPSLDPGMGKTFGVQSLSQSQPAANKQCE